MLYCQHIISTGDPGFQRNPHSCVCLCGLFQNFYFFQHLFSAFCPADRFFTIELTQFGNDFLLVLDLLLLIQISLIGGFSELSFLFAVGRIIS